MSKFGDSYVLEAGKKGHDRLRVISEIHDGRTRQLLEKAGLIAGQRAGQRYVEFGCGLGYVTRWAASIADHATGIDLSEDQVAAAAAIAHEERIANVEFRVGSIYEPGLEAASFDVSYNRWLMVHLDRPVDAMRSIYRALKPGGVMVCEEADVTGVCAMPVSSAYEDFRDIAVQAGKFRNVDYTGGRQAHLWALEAGFELVDVDAYHPHYLHGPHKGFWNWTFCEAGENLVKAGLMTAEKLAELKAGMDAADASPTTVVAHCRMFQLIARKPA